MPKAKTKMKNKNSPPFISYSTMTQMVAPKSKQPIKVHGRNLLANFEQRKAKIIIECLRCTWLSPRLSGSLELETKYGQANILNVTTVSQFRHVGLRPCGSGGTILILKRNDSRLRIWRHRLLKALRFVRTAHI